MAYVRDTGLFHTANVDNAGASFAALPMLGHDVFVLCAAYCVPGNGAQAASDNQSHTYTKEVEKVTTNAGNHASAAIHRTRVATSSGTFTVTVDVSASNSGNYYSGVGVEFSGLMTSPKDVSATGTTVASGTSGNSGTTSSTAQARELVMVAAIIDANDANVNVSDPPSTGYTTIATDQNAQAVIGFQGSYKTVLATGTQVGSWTFDTANFDSCICTFKYAGQPMVKRFGGVPFTLGFDNRGQAWGR